MFNLCRWYVRCMEAAASVPARRMLKHAIEAMPCKLVDGVTIYYRDEAEAALAERSIGLLKECDYLAYQSVKKHVKTIVCCGGVPSWNAGKSAGSIGIRLGVYFDELTPSKRTTIDERRYGCILLRCALLVRLLRQFQITTVRFGGRRANKRIWDLVNRRDITCSERLGCEMKYIYELQRWMGR